jgi:hypothetical protein
MPETDEIVDAELSNDGPEDGEEVEEMRNLPAVRTSEAIVARAEISVEEVVAQKEKIVQIMQAVMTEGVHYGLIPGVNKPSLFKPGAEAINVALRLAPHYESEKIWHDDGHLTVSAKCILRHIPTDLVVATGEGLCTSRESRYAYRNAKRLCPNCGQETIIKGKAEYGGGWVCWKKEGGCGTNFPDGDQQIESQEIGKVANPDLPDTFNTVLKMADKRALTAATLNGTAASDVFTQDVEDTKVAADKPDVAPEPDEPQEFNVARDLLKDAPRGKEAVQAVMTNLDPTLDWAAVIAQVTQAEWGKDSWRELDESLQGEFWTRLANALGWIHAAVGSGDFPPAPPDKIVAGFAYAFDGVAVELVWLEPDDAPLGKTPED